MTDRIAAVWTRMGQQPIKMGVLIVTDTQSRFTYTPEYQKTGMRGLGLVYPPDQFRTTISRERSEYFDLLPPLQSLVPPSSERNFQRALLLKYLKSIHIHPKAGFDTDWELLIRAGHGAIGHLDVFANDEAAIQWYSTPSRRPLTLIDEKFGFSLKEFLTWYDDDANALIEVLGPTPTLRGAIPKLPISIPKTGWDNRIGLPSRFGDTDRTDVILKLENSSVYPGLIELEMLGLEIHRKAGFEVPRYWEVSIAGLQGLAIERFDRTEMGVPVFMESIYSVLASGSRTITHHYSATYDFIIRALNNARLQLVDDPAASRRHLVERLIMAMLTGNGDLHLENLSFIERNSKIVFSPVYDPTPMRAYKIHNMITPPDMLWGDYGSMPDDYLDGETEVDFKNAWLRFIRTADIRKPEFQSMLERLMAATSDYTGMIQKLKTLPDEHKNNLINIHAQMRVKFLTLLE